MTSHDSMCFMNVTNYISRNKNVKQKESSDYFSSLETHIERDMAITDILKLNCLLT